MKLITLMAALLTFQSAFAVICPLKVKVSDISVVENGLTKEEAKDLKRALMDELTKKNYSPEELTSFEYGDVEASSIVSFGSEPYLPFIKSCSTDIRILKTLPTGYGVKTLFAEDFDHQGPLMDKLKCISKTKEMYAAIPKCKSL